MANLTSIVMGEIVILYSANSYEILYVFMLIISEPNFVYNY